MFVFTENPMQRGTRGGEEKEVGRGGEGRGGRS